MIAKHKLVLVFVAGWLLAVILPPQRLASFFSGNSS
jgi:hypothetical protein